MTWSLVKMICRLLEPDERQAVLGDLAESGETGIRALASVGCVTRPVAALPAVLLSAAVHRPDHWALPLEDRASVTSGDPADALRGDPSHGSLFMDGGVCRVFLGTARDGQRRNHVHRGSRLGDLPATGGTHRARHIVHRPAPTGSLPCAVRPWPTLRRPVRPSDSTREPGDRWRRVAAPGHPDPPPVAGS